MPARSASCASSGEKGSLRIRLTVSSSTTSTVLIARMSPLRAEFSSVSDRSMLNFTASALNAEPSWKSTPLRRFSVMVRSIVRDGPVRHQLADNLGVRIEVEELVAEGGEDLAAAEGPALGRVKSISILADPDPSVADCAEVAAAKDSESATADRNVANPSCATPQLYSEGLFRKEPSWPCRRRSLPPCDVSKEALQALAKKQIFLFCPSGQAC